MQNILKLIHKIILLITIQCILRVQSDHVSIVRCAEDANCLQHINEQIVANILTSMRNESEPCDNFWDYACGSWTAAPYYDHVDNFGAIDNYYVQRMQKYLKLTNNEIELELSNLMSKLSTYYQACKDMQTYYLQVNKYFEELHMEWPASARWLNVSAALNAATKASHWQLQDFNWLEVIAVLRRYGVNSIFLDESVGYAYNESSKYVIELKMPDDDDNFQTKYDFVNYFVEFGWAEHASEQHVELATEIYEFEKQLQQLRAKHNTDNEHMVAENQVPDAEQQMTLSELQVKVPQIDWFKYFNIILEQQLSVEKQQKLPLEVEGLAYMQDLAALLQQTDNRIIALYITMRLCKYLLESSPQITDKNCIDHMGVVMPLGMNFIYNRYIYKTRADDEKLLLDIFAKLKLQFLYYLQVNKLDLSELELDYLEEKLLQMQLRIGNLPLDMPVSYYNHYYDAANLSSSDFFYNHLTMLRFRTRQQHADLLLEERVNLHSFHVYDDITQIRNAPYFVHQRNLLIVPMIFLQMPFYHSQLHSVFHYSLLGWILAHELNHAFEMDGIALSAAGTDSPIGAAIKQKHSFRAGVKCLQRTPTASIIERMADVNGFQLAYDAYFAVFTNITSSTSSLAFKSSALLRQLYFLNFAQFFCGNLPRPIDHDRDDVRVIEILANMPEFAETFQCSPQTRENPTLKCQMWRS